MSSKDKAFLAAIQAKRKNRPAPRFNKAAKLAQRPREVWTGPASN